MNISARFLLVFVSLVCASLAYSDNSIEAQLKKVAEETQKSLPMMINTDIQATSVGAVGKVLLNRYNFTKKKSAIPNINALLNEYSSNSINAACTNPEMRRAIDSGVSIEYQYYDINNAFVMQYKVDANSCSSRK